MNNDARESILTAIRTHLAASVPFEEQQGVMIPVNPVMTSNSDPLDLFKQSVESVAGRCIVTADVTDVLRRILIDLRPRRVALSDRVQLPDLDIEEVCVAPDAHDIFRFDVGISRAQAAIAETGTLVLDSACERHRLVSLVPPIHIAIVSASTICQTLSEALTLLRKDREISPAVTFITGPSRTADIELTLAIGVHGPRELYVIVDESS